MAVVDYRWSGLRITEPGALASLPLVALSISLSLSASLSVCTNHFHPVPPRMPSLNTLMDGLLKEIQCATCAEIPGSSIPFTRSRGCVQDDDDWNATRRRTTRWWGGVRGFIEKYRADVARFKTWNVYQECSVMMNERGRENGDGGVS